MSDPRTANDAATNGEFYECPTCCFGTNSYPRFIKHGEEHAAQPSHQTPADPVATDNSSQEKYMYLCGEKEAEISRLTAERDTLQQWKESAMVELGKWDKLCEHLPYTIRLGYSKAEEVLRILKVLKVAK